VTPQCAAFHGASANPASLQTTPDGSITLVVTKKRCSANSFFNRPEARKIKYRHDADINQH
jgi:hypothetical protein